MLIAMCVLLRHGFVWMFSGHSLLFILTLFDFKNMILITLIFLEIFCKLWILFTVRFIHTNHGFIILYIYISDSIVSNDRTERRRLLFFSPEFLLTFSLKSKWHFLSKFIVLSLWWNFCTNLMNWNNIMNNKKKIILWSITITSATQFH